MTLSRGTSCRVTVFVLFVSVKTEARRSFGQNLQLRYCKRGYFRWGKISRICLKDISLKGNFHDCTPISFIKAYGFYFRVGVNFREADKIAKNTKITPTRKLPRLQ